MKRLKNKDGSAILWTVLLTVIITILLGTLLTLSYGYHNSTLVTIKKQQAYFTARSAVDMIVSDISTNGSKSNIMPKRNGGKLTIDDFEFTQDMGTAKAEIKKASEDMVKVKVTATYADENYTMNLILRNQSLYFGGAAVKNLEIPASSTFTLTENTDLYIDNENGFTGKLNVGGNLICKGDITLLPGSKVAGITFDNKTYYDDNPATTYPRKHIWTSTKYILSNHEMDATYPSIIQTTRMFIKTLLQGNYNAVYSYTQYGRPFNPNFANDFFLSEGTISNNIRYIKIKYRDRWLFPDEDTYDITQIEYNKYDAATALDKVTPLAYVIVEDNCKLRVKYGLSKDYAGFIGSMQDFLDWISNKKITYLNVYLGENAILELGNTAGSSPEELKRLNFYMSIYGMESSKVILHNNVTVHGSVNVGTLKISEGASVKLDYITSNGGQVAKQKVDELWVVSNYSD